MNLRKIIYPFLIAGILTCSNKKSYLASYSNISPVNLEKGVVNCIESNLVSASNELSMLFGLENLKIPTVSYADLGPYSAFYVRPDRMEFDTSKIKREKSCIPILLHELGHHKMDVSSRESGNGGWPSIFSIKNKDVQISELGDSMKLKIAGEGLITEGVAEYIENLGEYVDSPPWPPDIAGEYFDYYNNGFYFVKDLMDEFGYPVIKNMQENLPSREELLHPEMYTNRIRKVFLQNRRK